MLSVVIEMRGDDAAGLAETLACLVPAAVAGVVRDVTLLDGGMGPESEHVADHAGCNIMRLAEFGDSLALSRSDWVLLLECGAELLPGWIEAAHRYIATNPSEQRAGHFRPVLRTRSLFAFLPLPRSRSVSRGLLAPRLLLSRRYRIGMRLADLARAVPSQRLDASIRPPSRSAGA